MHNARRFALAVSASILVTGGVASAADKQDENKAEASSDAAAKPISAAPLLGFGSTLGFGVGARAGVNVTPELYVGGQFMYHPGYSYGTYGGLGSSWSASFFYPSGEVGYDIRVAHGRVMIRPYGGVALLVAHVSGPDVNGVSTSETGTAMGIYPGCAVTYDIPRSPAFVGGDARLLFALAGNTSSSFGAFGTVGVRF